MTSFDLSELQAQAILDMRLARLAALERKKIEDEYLAVIQLIAELEDILANPARVLEIIKDELAELKRKYAGERRTRVADDASREMTDEDLIADEDVVVTISRPRLRQAPAGRHVPPPAPRRQGHHRPRDPRGGRGRAPPRRQHPRLGAVLHEPRPGLQLEGPPDPRRQPPGQGHPDHQPAGRPGRGGRGPDGHDHPAGLRGRLVPGHGDPQGHHQEDAARAVREGPLERASGRSRSTRATSWPGSTSAGGHDDIIIATALGKIARFHETRSPGDGPDAGRRHRHPPRPQGRLGHLA